MEFPTDLLYTKDHEWAKITGDEATIGITDHAQSSLGDIVFVDLPKVGRELKSHESFGVVESIKAVSDLYAPLAGKVVEVNDKTAADPALVNRDPQNEGWLIKVKISDMAATSSLLKADAYKAYVESLK